MQKLRRRGVTIKPPTTTRAIYRKSRFHIPVLIVTSFLILEMIPDLVAESIECCNKENLDIVLSIYFTSHALSGMTSAYTYVFMEKSVKRLSQAKLKRVRSMCQRKSSIGIGKQPSVSTRGISSEPSVSTRGISSEPSVSTRGISSVFNITTEVEEVKMHNVRKWLREPCKKVGDIGESTAIPNCVQVFNMDNSLPSPS